VGPLVEDDFLVRGDVSVVSVRSAAGATVADRGIGLQPEGTHRLFDAFYTTKPQGMGLGLAISRSIIEAHGGRLSAAPNHGRGAIFSVQLPAANRFGSG
jgi:signal transduction histidine kinase